MKLSIYTSAFNVIKNKFDYLGAIENFTAFADEVVVAVNQSEDESFDRLYSLSRSNSKLVVFSTDFSYNDPWLDGRVKNAALQATSNKIKIGVDLDERIPLRQSANWRDLGENLLDSSYSAYFIPSVNLYGDVNHYFSIGKKWYMHREGLFRGPVTWARNENGTVDTDKSDTCELIDHSGNLVPTLNLSLTDAYVFHLGYMNLEDRLIRNRNFWCKHWSIEAGKSIDIPLSIEDISKDKIKKKHNLPLWQ